MRFVISFLLITFLITLPTATYSDVLVPEAVVCREVVDRTPVGTAENFSNGVGKLICFSKIEGLGTDKGIVHRWIHGEEIVAEVNLKVNGWNWRTWSAKSIDPGRVGDWRVEVVDKATNHVLKTITFQVGKIEEDKEKRAATEGDLNQVKVHLESLAKDDPDSISKGMIYTKTLLNELNPSPQVDEIFLEYFGFYATVVRTYSRKISDEDSPAEADLYEITEKKESDPPLSESMRIFSKVLARNGMMIEQTEGIAFIDQAPDFVFLNLVDYLTEPVKEYMRIRTAESRKRFSEDAGLSISFSEVAGRVLNWEKFQAKYPDYFKMSVVDGHIELYTRTLLGGMSNTPSFDFSWEGTVGKLRDGPRVAYEYIIKNYPSTNIGQTVRAYYDVIKQSDYENSDEVKSFLKEIDFVPMRGVQLPLR
jgi:hypothetical protein